MQRERLLKLCREVLSIPTAPYHEEGVRAYVKEFCAARPALGWSEDRFGNVLVRYRRGKPKHAFAFSAHMDHPGFEALRCTKDGRLTARFNGGVRPEFFAGTKVRFFGGRTVRGVVREVNIRNGQKIAEIDAEARVEPNTCGMWDLPVMRLRGDRLHTRSCDDTVGTISVLALLDELCRLRLSADVTGVLTRAEEVGFAGALALAEAGSVPKRYKFIAIETSSAVNGAKIGSGPVIRVGDKRSIFDGELTGYLTAAARELAREDDGFSFQRKLMDAGTCESTVYQLHGYQSAALCISLGNYHNMGRGNRIRAEVVSISDLEGMVRLHVHVVRCAKRYDTMANGLAKSLAKHSRKVVPRLLKG